MRSLFLGLVMVTGIAVVSCAAGQRQIRLTGSPELPAARGTVRATTTDDGNTRLYLVVEHLAEPRRVDPQAQVYIVWLRGTEGAEPQSLGALRVDDNLKGSITAVTPLREFDLMITAEPTQGTTSPTGKTVLNTHIDLD